MKHEETVLKVFVVFVLVGIAFLPWAMSKADKPPPRPTLTLVADKVVQFKQDEAADVLCLASEALAKGETVVITPCGGGFKLARIPAERFEVRR